VRGDGVVDAAVADITGGFGVDQVYLAAGGSSNDPVELAAKLSRDRGRVIDIGKVSLNLPWNAYYEKELDVRFSRSYGPGRYDPSYELEGRDYPIGYVRWTQQRNMEAILELQVLGKLDLRRLIEEVVPLDDVADAYQRIIGPSEGRPSGAVVLSYGGARGPESPEAPVAVPASSGDAGPVRVGLLGPGGFARSVIIPAFRDAGARLEVVGGGSGPSAEEAMREFGFNRVAESEDALIDDPGVDAVAICTRHESHAELCARALRAGKHVFCEKPLAMSMASLDDVMGAAEGSGRVLAVGFNRRFAPLMRELRDFVRVEGMPLTAVYRVSAGAIPADNWVHDLREGGGRALGEACHFVDVLTYLAGAPVVEVHAVGHGSPELPIQAHDNLVVSLRFADGSVGSIAYVADGSPRVAKERVEVFCDRHTAVLDDFTALQLFGPDQDRRRESREADKGHRDEIAAFVAAAEQGAPPVALDEVRNVSLATLAVVESLRSGRPVRLDALVAAEPVS
jgi:predicted dehydrogenase